VSTGAQYVVAAYGVVLVAALLYVVAVAARTARLARESELLARLLERRRAEETVEEPTLESADT
jgi:heme exporter protein D